MLDHQAATLADQGLHERRGLVGLDKRASLRRVDAPEAACFRIVDVGPAIADASDWGNVCHRVPVAFRRGLGYEAVGFRYDK
jgi:hypothetical protein